MKKSIVFLFAGLLFVPSVYASSGIATSYSSVSTHIEGSGSVTTHIESTVNGNTEVLDTTDPGTHILINTSDDSVPTISIIPTLLPTITPFPTTTHLHKNHKYFHVNFFNNIQKFFLRLLFFHK